MDKPRPGGGLDSEFSPQLDTFFARAVVLVALLRSTGREGEWEAELLRLLAAFPTIDETQMGFPPAWRERAFWSLPPADPEPQAAT